MYWKKICIWTQEGLTHVVQGPTELCIYVCVYICVCVCIHFWTVGLEKSFESPLDCKEIKPVHPKNNQPWIFIGKTDAEALILWPPDAKSQLVGKDPDAGKDWKQKEKGVAEAEMVR